MSLKKYCSKQYLATLAGFLRGLFWDAILLLGCAVFVFGVWKAWEPAGIMTAGVLLVAVSFLFGARKVPTSAETHK